MIGGLLLFLGSAGYLTHKAASSQRAQFEIKNYTRNTGINIERQMKLERMSLGSTPYDRSQFVSLLKNANLNGITMQQAHEQKRKELLEKIGKFESYSQAYNKIRSFGDMVTLDDRNYAVWIILKSEGWRYNKQIISGLPSYCDGYEAWKDTQANKIIRRI